MTGFSLSASARRFVADESGTTAIEYGLVAALIAVAIVAPLQIFGSSLTTMFNNVSQHFTKP